MWLLGGLVGTTVTGIVLLDLLVSVATDPWDMGGAFVRAAGDSEIYGGRIISLLEPWPGAPGFLGEAARTYAAKTYLGNPVAWHGSITVLGTWLILGIALGSLLARRVSSAGTRLWLDVQWAAGIGVLLILLYVTTGLGAVVSYIALPELRAWDRFSVMVAAVATLVLGLVTEQLVRQPAMVRRPAAERGLGVTVALSLWGVLVLDQGGLYGAPLAPPEWDGKLYAARTAVADLDRTVGDECPIMQLPATQFPETAPQGTVGDYDYLLSYVASGRAPWSYGAVKGHLAGDWFTQLDLERPELVVDQLAAAGYCAVEVLDGAVTPESPSAGLVAALPSLLGRPVARDVVNGRTYYDLTGRRRQLEQAFSATELRAIRLAVLRPLIAVVDHSSAIPQTPPSAAQQVGMSAAGSTRIQVLNPTRQDVDVQLDVVLEVVPATPGTRISIGEDEVRTSATPTTLTVRCTATARDLTAVDVSVLGPLPPGVSLRVTVSRPSYDRALPEAALQQTGS
jgi:hypothetical protein